MSDDLHNQASQHDTVLSDFENSAYQVDSTIPGQLASTPPNNGSSFVKKFGTKKVISTFFGFLVLAIGVGSGVLLVMEPQVFVQKAAYPTSTPISTPKDTCGSGSACKSHIDPYYCNAAGGSVTSCSRGSTSSDVGNCCFPNNKCLYTTDCPSGVCRNYVCQPIVSLTPINKAFCRYNNGSGVPSLSQTNPFWANKSVIGGQTVSNCPFSYIGCAPTTIATVISYKQGKCYSPYETYQKVTPELTCDGIGSNGAADYLTKMGISTTKITTSTDPIANKKAVVNAFNSSGGKPIVVGVNIKEPSGSIVNHVTLIVGIDGNGNPIFNDPLAGPNIPLESKGYTVLWSNADASIVN